MVRSRVSRKAAPASLRESTKRATRDSMAASRAPPAVAVVTPVFESSSDINSYSAGRKVGPEQALAASATAGADLCEQGTRGESDIKVGVMARLRGDVKAEGIFI